MQFKKPGTRASSARHILLPALFFVTAACAQLAEITAPAKAVPTHLKNPEQAALQSEFEAAINHGKIDVARQLLDANVEVNVLLSSNLSPLSKAANEGDMELVDLLLRHGADIAMYNDNEYGTIPLIEAALGGHTGVVRLLLDNGVDINQRDRFGDPALNWATYYGHAEVVSLLIERHAKLTVVGSGGGTALNTAVAQKHPEIEKLLRDAGATE